MSKLTTIFTLDFKVRDYECDIQGIVNNACYMNYLEHTRHEHLDSIGLNFKTLFDRGIYLVATEVHMVYKKSLMPGDMFQVTSRIEKESKFRLKFIQEILNKDKEIVLTSTLLGAAITSNKKPILLQKLFELA
jgi:acyl-CoA thioester hydrolase